MLMRHLQFSFLRNIAKICFFAIILVPAVLFSQKPEKDKGIFVERKSTYYQNVILPDLDKSSNYTAVQTPKTFAVDLSGKKFPVQLEKYKTFWHNPPISQGRTGTCWVFATTSFLESEVKRIQQKEVKLSEMFYVYWEYVDRARDFIKTRGKTYFAEGSEASSILILMRNYGTVPASVYKGIAGKNTFHDHKKMVNEMEKWLESCKKSNLWAEEEVLVNIKSIMNFYMGKPPVEFEYEGVKYTPKSFQYELLKLQPNDYFSFMSTASSEFNQKGELVEDDNWRHCDDYYNLKLEDYFKNLVGSLEKGCTACVCGDISEPGYDKYAEVAIIPSFDIPSDYIDDYSRQMRLNNNSTTDDHCVHFVGIYKDKDVYWFLAKDSGGSGFEGTHLGYHFYHQDYVKLKIMNIMVHKEAASEILNKIIK